jgi:hypothetical protein
MSAAAVACNNSNLPALPANAQWSNPDCANATAATPRYGACTAECLPGFASSEGFSLDCNYDYRRRSLQALTVSWKQGATGLTCTRENQMLLLCCISS